MIKTSPDELRRLLDLQEIDTAIRQLQYRRANLPEQQALDANAETLEKVAAEYANARDEQQRLDARQRRLEQDVASVDARRKSEEGRMYSGLITSEREVGALRAELASLKSRKHDLEDELLEVMERREEVDSLVDTLKARHAELSGQMTSLTAARDEAASDIDAELVKRGDERDAVTADLPSDVLAYYEDLRGRKGGLAVAELRGRTCQGCRLELTPTELEHVHDAAQRGLAKCEQCGRILVPV